MSPVWRPRKPRSYKEMLVPFTREVGVPRSGGRSKDRKTRVKTYTQVFYKWIRVPIEDGLDVSLPRAA